MTSKNSTVTTHAKCIAILWFVLLIATWFSEHGYRPLFDAFSEVGTRQWQSGQSMRKSETNFGNDLEIFENIRPYYNWTTFWAFGESNGFVVRGQDGWMYYRSLFKPIGQTDTFQTDFIELFKLIERWYAAKGCQLYLLPLPEKGMIHPYFPKEAAERVADREKDLQQFIKRASKKRLQVIDVLPVYKTLANQGVNVFLPDDTHWSMAGMTAAAEEILKAVRQNTAITPQNVAFDSAIIERSSDLPNMLNFPQKVIENRHLNRIEMPKVSGQGPPQMIVFGTSFSYSYGLADNLAKAASVLSEDFAFPGLTIPDLLLIALDRLQHGEELAPGTSVVMEFPYRLLNRTDDLTELKLQFQWQRLVRNQRPQVTLAPENLRKQNVDFSDAWYPTGDPSMLFIDKANIDAFSNPTFLKIRYKTPYSKENKTRLKTFYDIGKGYRSNNHQNFQLSHYHGWQTRLIPVKFKRQLPEGIRIDFMGQVKPFELATIEIY